jgi:hypothetical protein
MQEGEEVTTATAYVGRMTVRGADIRTQPPKCMIVSAGCAASTTIFQPVAVLWSTYASVRETDQCREM